MIPVLLQNLIVGKTYYIHQLKDELTHQPISHKYKAVCTINYSTHYGWIEFLFKNVQGINTNDLQQIAVSWDEVSFYQFYLCKSDEIIEKSNINSVLQLITRDTHFHFY